MKPINFRSITIILIYLIISTSFGFFSAFLNNINKSNLPHNDNSIEKWRNLILNHNNINLETFEGLPQEVISNFYDQLNIYQNWARGFYSADDKNQLLLSVMHTPEIRYIGPNNHPIEGFDLKRHDDESFELNFRIDDRILNEWVVRVYTYLDYVTYDTLISDSDKFEDGNIYKYYQPGQEPNFEDLNPDVTFMGIDFNKILEDHTQWTNSERDYSARKSYPGRIDEELYFHVKVLYRKDIYETDGWYSYYFYKNFYISWYWASNFQYRILNIKDDDTNTPIISNINVLNTPIYDAYDEITLEINAFDTSGISELYVEILGDIYYDTDHDNFINISNPRIPGDYTLIITALDGDLDREGDQLSSTVYSNLNIFDDDTIAPIISNINILNTPIYDAYNEINIGIEVEDSSGISELYIKILENVYYDTDNDTFITISNPRIPGDYILNITAVDNDLDEEGDQLSSTVYSNLNIIDDDITPPQIIINEDELNWNISIHDNDGMIDSEASGNFTLEDQYGNIILNGLVNQEDTVYCISKDLINSMKLTTITLTIHATNNDCEWEGDEETIEEIRIISITLEDLFNYVDMQIENLKEFIKQNIQSCFKCFFIKILNLTQQNLRCAYLQIIQNNLLCGLYDLTAALCYIETITSIILCFFQMCCCYDAAMEYIVITLNDIRNNIVLLKGNSVDYVKSNDLGYQIASIEVKVLNLKDFIKDSINYYDSKRLIRVIKEVANLLETALFYLAQDIDYTCLLTFTQDKLDLAKCKVNYLLETEKITLDLADILINKITEIQNDLN